MNQLTRNWHIVYTRPQWEKKVAKKLDRKKIQNYCPLARVQRSETDRKKIQETPLFTSFVFVNICAEEMAEVKRTAGVLHFVHWLQNPAIIKNEEISIIRSFLNDYQTIKLEKTSVKLNEKVRIINGPLMERDGKVLEIKHKTIKVLLPSLGYMLAVEIEKSHIDIPSIFAREEIAIA
jgi:transcription antitermination factor NusG